MHPPRMGSAFFAGKGANCPILILGTLNGKRLRLSTAGFLPPDNARDLEAARDLALLWEKTGPQSARRSTPAPASRAEPEAPLPSVEMAVAAFMADAKDRGNSVATLYKKRVVFETACWGSAPAKGIRFVSRIGLSTPSGVARTWNVDALSRAKRQGQVIGFLWFCERAGWLPRNSAADITRGLGKIQVKARQTGYFMPDEYKAVIDATYVYSDRPSVDKHNSLTIGGERIRALTELMRWTGLRIRDAVTLEKRSLSL